MHEVSIMQAALDAAERHARSRQCARIASIRLRVGILSGVVPESLEFAFSVLRDGTMAAAADLRIETAPARFRCSGCEKEFEFERFLFDCPECAAPLVLQGGGRELDLLDVEAYPV
jgi:hydrogenase nickel incorporation protein HypA/HybF